MRTAKATQENKSLRHELSTIKSQMDKAQTGSVGYTPALSGYMSNFITSYINMTGKTEDMNKWQSDLKPYLANGIDTQKLIGTNNLKAQSLTSTSIVSIYVKNGVKIAQSKVDYKVNMDGGNNWASKTIYLNVPYAVKDNVFTVVANPFVTEQPSFTGKVSTAEKRNENTLAIADTAVTGDVTNFTNKFFDKYVSSSADEMSFIMSNPVGLNGDYTVKTVSDLHISGSKSKPEVSGTVSLVQKDTNITHTEQFDLKLQKQEGTYFVLSYTH
ncbi:putative membrane protein [Weissella oryzae SG25]|uniref:Putative membrane protein n=1 Tax=Weissella oryzae (strain DSM 25784 / JCM 18191 / LMG 30913 / SG25) TaxID=1329250 RepID=A0A069CTN8_WEIOS|nr:conjugal transfer protein [Weissella oryzae]GAK30757.1 putative membrane protein [Weissella oryzae SG25]